MANADVSSSAVILLLVTSSVGGDQHSKSILETIALLQGEQMESNRFNVSNMLGPILSLY